MTTPTLGHSSALVTPPEPPKSVSYPGSGSEEREENETTWWRKYAEGNWVGLSSIPTIIAEAEKRGHDAAMKEVDEEITEIMRKISNTSGFERADAFTILLALRERLKK